MIAAPDETIFASQLPACFFFWLARKRSQGSQKPLTAPVKTEFNRTGLSSRSESAYLFGVINPPRDYQVGAEFITARVRWGVIERDGWLRGYNQFYISGIVERFFKGSRITISD